MSEMVERVARALYKEHLEKYQGPTMPMEFEKLPGFSKVYGEALARAAIEACRKALKDSEFRRGPSGGHGERSEPSIDEMFDEALK